MNAIHKKRLLKLATFLREKVPDEHFRLAQFVVRVPGLKPSKQLRKIAAGEVHGCGTAACALGWCPVAFPNEWDFNSKMFPRVTGSPDDDCDSWSDAEDFFGLTGDEVSDLFLPSPPEYETRLHVAAALEALVGSHA